MSDVFRFAADRLEQQANLRSRWYCKLPTCDGRPHLPHHHFCDHPLESPHHSASCNHARTAQRPPEGDWLIWLIRSGRGFGKTRSGSEFINDRTYRFGARRIALIGRSAADCRDVMVEGESGLLQVAAHSFPHPNVAFSAIASQSKSSYQPKFEPTKRRVTWPKGTVATMFTAEEPDQLRGPEHELAWGDEMASWADAHLGDRIDTTFNNLMLGLRIGRPRCVLTTTPKPNKLFRQIVARSSTRITKGATYDNLENLAPSFREEILNAYEGTRIGRQELLGEDLDDIEGALFAASQIELCRGQLLSA